VLSYFAVVGAAAVVMRPVARYTLPLMVAEVPSLQVIVDVTTARPEIQNYGIDATYTLCTPPFGASTAAVLRACPEIDEEKVAAVVVCDRQV